MKQCQQMKTTRKVPKIYTVINENSLTKHFFIIKNKSNKHKTHFSLK